MDFFISFITIKKSTGEDKFSMLTREIKPTYTDIYISNIVRPRLSQTPSKTEHLFNYLLTLFVVCCDKTSFYIIT